MAETRRDRVFIVHRMGQHECEGVAGGTAQEIRFWNIAHTNFLH